MRPSEQEFIEAHQGQLQYIGTEIGRVLSAERAFEIELSSFSEEARLVHTSFTPEFFMDLYDGQLAPEDAAKMSTEENYHQSELGVDLVQHTVVVASLYAISQSVKSATPPVERSRDNAKPLDFDLATYRADELDANLQVAQVTTTGLEKYGSAELWQVKQEDELTQSRLVYISLRGEPIHLSHSVGPKQDEDLLRWMRILGPGYSRHLTHVLAGAFETEDDLDGILAATADLFAGTPTEAAAAVVLQEMRARALSAQGARELRQEFDLDLPSLAHLGSVAARLQSF